MFFQYLPFFFKNDREQCDRESALEDFKTGATRILIATDVASRGLDVKDITWVLKLTLSPTYISSVENLIYLYLQISSLIFCVRVCLFNSFIDSAIAVCVRVFI